MQDGLGFYRHYFIVHYKQYNNIVCMHVLPLVDFYLYCTVCMVWYIPYVEGIVDINRDQI